MHEATLHKPGSGLSDAVLDRSPAQSPVIAPAILFVAYPVLAHLSIVAHQSWIEWLALLCLYAALFFRPLISWRLGVWLGFTAFGIASGLLALAGQARYALYVPSLVLPGLIALSFTRSLRPGEVPTITRIAAAMQGQTPLTAEQIVYTRAVTWVWSATTATIFLITLGLLVFGSARAWSLFSNFLSYCILAGLFVAEYLFRRLHFPNHARSGLVGFVRAAILHGPR